MVCDTKLTCKLVVIKKLETLKAWEWGYSVKILLQQKRTQLCNLAITIPSHIPLLVISPVLFRSPIPRLFPSLCVGQLCTYFFTASDQKTRDETTSLEPRHVQDPGNETTVAGNTNSCICKLHGINTLYHILSSINLPALNQKINTPFWLHTLPLLGSPVPTGTYVPMCTLPSSIPIVAGTTPNDSTSSSTSTAVLCKTTIHDTWAPPHYFPALLQWRWGRLRMVMDN